MAKRLPTPHGMGTDGHGNELAMVVRVQTGQSESERSAKKLLATPRTKDADGWVMNKARQGQKPEDTLTGQVLDAMGIPKFAQLLPTPAASNRDNAGGTNRRRAAQKRGTSISGQLNPTFVEAMMGYPPGWTEAAYSPTRGSRASRPSRSESGTAPTGSAPSGTPSSLSAPTRSSGRSMRRRPTDD